jgi:hypothetical protein
LRSFLADVYDQVELPSGKRHASIRPVDALRSLL